MNLVGKILSQRYRIDDFLGRGGMADVYKAWDLQRSTYLALKLLRQDLAQDVIFLRRFQREAQNLAKLQHPNIVRFYGIDQDDIHVFMLMDHIEGTTLQTVIFRNRSQPLSYFYVRNVLGSVGAALHYAHHMGLVHCDIKPGNIMIDQTGEVLLTDFGVARMTDAATATMVGYGTPAYMPPELVRGQEPTLKSDIYSLGIVLYEMVTGGERPFTGERANITGTVSERVRWEQLYLDPTSPRIYNTNLPAELEASILRCLVKKPADRFTNVLSLIADYKVKPPIQSKPVKVTKQKTQIESAAETASEQQFIPEGVASVEEAQVMAVEELGKKKPIPSPKYLLIAFIITAVLIGSILGFVLNHGNDDIKFSDTAPIELTAEITLNNQENRDLTKTQSGGFENLPPTSTKTQEKTVTITQQTQKTPTFTATPTQILTETPTDTNMPTKTSKISPTVTDTRFPTATYQPPTNTALPPPTLTQPLKPTPIPPTNTSEVRPPTPTPP